MGKTIGSEGISRRKALSLLGLAAMFGLACRTAWKTEGTTLRAAALLLSDKIRPDELAAKRCAPRDSAASVAGFCWRCRQELQMVSLRLCWSQQLVF